MATATPEPDIWVVVASNGAPPYYTKEDGIRYGPIVFEVDVDTATRDNAIARAAQAERDGYGACRIARLVFEDNNDSGEALNPSN
jgi:hypothetical protein